MLLIGGFAAVVRLSEEVAVDASLDPLGPAVDFGRIALAARPSVAKVEAQTCAGPMAGSGFVIEGGTLITNRHLVDGADHLLATSGSDEYPAAVVVRRLGADVDLATAQLATPHALPVADADPAAGTEVVLTGWSGGGYRWLAGRVHLHTDGTAYGIPGPVMLLEPATTFGYSGGPVLNARGEVVGVLQAVDHATDLSLAIPISSVHEWLQMDAEDAPSTTCID